MTLEQLKMFKLVAEQGTLKGASEEMHKTQSAISQGIKQLENQLKIRLFQRDGYRLALSAEGKQILSRTQRLLNETSEIKQLSHHIAKGNEAHITIAIEASYDLNLITPVLEKIQNEFPNTEIILKQEYLSGAFEAVENDKAELAITPINDLAFESDIFDHNWLYKGFLISVASPHLTSRHTNLKRVEELINEYQIVVQDSGQSSQGKNYSVQTGQRCWYVNDFTTKKTLVKSGMGWGRLPENRILEELKNGSLVKLLLDDVTSTLGLEYFCLKLRARVLGPVARRLWDSLNATKNR